MEPKGVGVLGVGRAGGCELLCSFSGKELVVFGTTIRQLQGDVQQRLVFRAQVKLGTICSVSVPFTWSYSLSVSVSLYLSLSLSLSLCVSFSVSPVSVSVSVSLSLFVRDLSRQTFTATSLLQEIWHTQKSWLLLWVPFFCAAHLFRLILILMFATGRGPGLLDRDSFFRQWFSLWNKWYWGKKKNLNAGHTL